MHKYKHLLFTGLAACLLLAPVPDKACADDAGELPPACRSECATPYGKVLGASTGSVRAYSNCRPGCVNPEANRWKDTYTGIKWQCVEYARRWLLVNRGAVFESVNTAADMWSGIEHLIEVETTREVPLESHLNGARQPPRIGDLLIYASAFQNTGHVAVVTDVDYESGHVEVGEQNYSNRPWSADHARIIEWVSKGDSYWLLDGYLIGWKRAAF